MSEALDASIRVRIVRDYTPAYRRVSERRRQLADPPRVVPDGETRFFFPARSRYVERCWLPVLEPTATVTLRPLAELVDAAPSSGCTVAVEDLEHCGRPPIGGRCSSTNGR